MLGLGVFGFVDVTAGMTDAADEVWLCGGVCFNVFCGFNAILNEFSFKRPFVQNCIANEF